MKRKILIYNNSTAFYFPEEEYKKLRTELDKIVILNNYTLDWNINRFIMKYSITSQMKFDILSIFEEKKKVIEEKKIIIKGFSGCLITGNKLIWK
ncbi:MAG: hypothetical protein MUP82_10315 [Candidatus Marinimicrobia bacterium]|nr:hypothetical protein [Candidatus Neomarinimicrobiota bacterium]